MIIIKTIGIILREFDYDNISFMGTRHELFKSLEPFDINIIGIPIDNTWNKIKNAITFCDGILLSGGNKFHDNDFKLIEYLYQNNIPTLGICLGMQSMAKYFNNKKEIEVDNHYSTNKYVHKIKINKQSKLYKILNKDEILVNSRHHTAIKNTNMLVNATSEDGIIEGIELPNHKFFIGIQWHPESLNDNNSYQLFKSFINAL